MSRKLTNEEILERGYDLEKYLKQRETKRQSEVRLKQGQPKRCHPREKDYWKIYHRDYGHSPYGKFIYARKNALIRNIEWKLTFDEWWKIWQDSGHWEERGADGFVMCRKSDEGSYNIDNVYIAHHTVNNSDAMINKKLLRDPNTGRYISPNECMCNS